MTVNIKEFPGTPLSESDFRNNDVLSILDELNGIFEWDTGIAIRTYLAGLKNGRLIGSQCKHCELKVIPPRTVCEHCFKPMEDYVVLQDSGTVNTFSICYVTWDVKRIKDPEIPAVIEIDGASPMHGIMHKLGEVDKEDVYIGMGVKAVWKPEKERTGSITDILYFKPYKDGDL